MRWSWLAGGIVGGAVTSMVTVASCGEPGAFVCEQDSECEHAGMTGICQLDVGYCSFPDVDCPSGQRFGTYSGGLAGACVGDELASTGSTTRGEPTTSEPLTTSLTTSEPTGASSDGASTTTGPDDDETTDAGVPTCPTQWWDCAWAWRLPLDVIWEGAPQADFPVRIALTPERIDLATVASDGSDLRVSTEAGELLPHELERFSADDGDAELWVRVPQLAAGTRLWLYWGNPGAPEGQDPAAVWSEDHAAVWHLGPALDDATGQHPLDDLATADADGRIGRARAFDGTTSLLRPIAQDDLLPLFSAGGTVSAWIWLDTWGQGGFGRIIDHATANTGAEGWHVAVGGAGELNPASLRFAFDRDVQRGTWESQADALALGVWQHVAVSYDADDPLAEPSFYVDGELVPANAVSVPMGAPNLVSPHPATIGAMPTGDLRFFDGVIDELRLSTVPRSGEWIAAEALAGVDVLLEYGAPEALPSP